MPCIRMLSAKSYKFRKGHQSTGARISSLRITLALPLAFGGSGLPPQDADWIDLRDHGWEALSIMLRKVG